MEEITAHRREEIILEEREDWREKEGNCEEKGKNHGKEKGRNGWNGSRLQEEEDSCVYVLESSRFIYVWSELRFCPHFPKILYLQIDPMMIFGYSFCSFYF